MLVLSNIKKTYRLLSSNFDIYTRHLSSCYPKPSFIHPLSAPTSTLHTSKYNIYQHIQTNSSKRLFSSSANDYKNLSSPGIEEYGISTPSSLSYIDIEPIVKSDIIPISSRANLPFHIWLCKQGDEEHLIQELETTFPNSYHMFFRSGMIVTRGNITPTGKLPDTYNTSQNSKNIKDNEDNNVPVIAFAQQLIPYCEPYNPPSSSLISPSSLSDPSHLINSPIFLLARSIAHTITKHPQNIHIKKIRLHILSPLRELDVRKDHIPPIPSVVIPPFIMHTLIQHLAILLPARKFDFINSPIDRIHNALLPNANHDRMPWNTLQNMSDSILNGSIRESYTHVVNHPNIPNLSKILKGNRKAKENSIRLKVRSSIVEGLWSNERYESMEDSLYEPECIIQVINMWSYQSPAWFENEPVKIPNPLIDSDFQFPTGFESMLISITSPSEKHRLRRCISTNAHGCVILPDNTYAHLLPLPPSTAISKLLESELRFGSSNYLIKSPRETLDLGAAPGSWSYVPLIRGAHVLSIDTGMLDSKLLAAVRRGEQVKKDPSILLKPNKGRRNKKLPPPAYLKGECTFLRDDGINFRLPNEVLPVDTLLCDIITSPYATFQLVQKWLGYIPYDSLIQPAAATSNNINNLRSVENTKCHRICITFKMQGSVDYPMIEKIKSLFPNNYTNNPLLSSGISEANNNNNKSLNTWEWKLKRLNSNKNEVCLFGMDMSCVPDALSQAIENHQPILLDSSMIKVEYSPKKQKRDSFPRRKNKKSSQKYKNKQDNKPQ